MTLVPRFFFNMVDGDLIEDREGLILDNLGSALAIAVKSAREIMADQVKEGDLSLAERIDVINEGGEVVGCIEFRDAVTIHD
ncbi:MAG: DUF6894 family protein [Sphingomicrobium sp.]